MKASLRPEQAAGAILPPPRAHLKLYKLIRLDPVMQSAVNIESYGAKSGDRKGGVQERPG